MWLHKVLPFGLLLAVTHATTNSSCNPKACVKNAHSEKKACGSDGLTYPNICHLEKARCVNKALALAKRGACRTPRACRDWVYQEQPFQAKCHTDGSYAAAQCLPEAGFCWCVTPQGIPLPYTTVRYKPTGGPHCGRRKKTHRRSPPRKGARGCKQPDKAKFNNNLINIFHTEWTRETGVYRLPSNETDNLVKQWKFRAMDLDRDGLLDKGEYRDLKRVAKKAVKPKRCAKAFPRSCDVNGDTAISLQEWLECLTRDGMDDGGGGEQSLSEDSGDTPEDYPEPMHAQKPLPHVLIGQSQSYDEESTEARDEEPTDCLSDRQTALHEGGQIYVPECTPDGRYKKIQCYKATGYCFCVHEDTGKNIPGTSVKLDMPKCDQLTPVNRPMKGCPDDKKASFLKNLLIFLHSQMGDLRKSNGNNSIPWMSSKEDEAATWTFVFLDKNKNKNLDRNEWKAFKDLVSKVKSLRKCGKKLPRYCDINKDRQISMTEWLSCLNIHQEPIANPPISSRSGKKNPLDVLLED